MESGRAKPLRYVIVIQCHLVVKLRIGLATRFLYFYVSTKIRLELTGPSVYILLITNRRAVTKMEPLTCKDLQGAAPNQPPWTSIISKYEQIANISFATIFQNNNEIIKSTPMLQNFVHNLFLLNINGIRSCHSLIQWPEYTAGSVCKRQVFEMTPYYLNNKVDGTIRYCLHCQTLYCNGQHVSANGI